MTDLTKPFDDNTIIDFGKHQGERLEDVPAKYLLWWYGENSKKTDLSKKSKLLVDYIEDIMEVLKKEARNI